jgi:Protein of unknown function (DUF3253)
LSEGEAAAIRAAILSAVAKRGVEKTICPSEIARALFANAWRAQLQSVRDVAYALQDAGELEVTQGGEVVNGRAARGAIRLRMKKM